MKVLPGRRLTEMQDWVRMDEHYARNAGIKGSEGLQEVLRLSRCILVTILES